MNLPSSRTYGGWLALVRILTGAIWLIHAIPKFLNGAAFLPPSGFFATYLQQGIATTVGPFHDFLANVVAPNAGVFAELVRFGELLVGISLVLGSVFAPWRVFWNRASALLHGRPRRSRDGQRLGLSLRRRSRCSRQ